jgi:hypothetical protein
MKKCLILLLAAAFLFVCGAPALAEEPQGPAEAASAVKSDTEKKGIPKRTKKAPKPDGRARDYKKEYPRPAPPAPEAIGTIPQKVPAAP